MKVKIKVAIVLLVLLSSKYSLVAQNIIGQPKFEFNSKVPDIQQMQQSIDVPVGLFTGTPNISIPLYKIKSRSIVVPLSFNYNGGGGIKAEDAAGPAGIGWSIQAGGVVTRTIRGNEDEGILYQTKPHVKDAGFPNGHYYVFDHPRDSVATFMHKYGGFYADGGNDIDMADLYSMLSAHNQALCNGDQPDPFGMQANLPFFTGLEDGEPDLFYFNFGGYSGKFYFNQNREPVMVPYTQDLLITTDFKYRADTTTAGTGIYGIIDTTIYAHHYFNSFKIATPEGVEYYFGETRQSRISTPYNGKPNVFTAWYLTRIIDRNSSDTIYFDYDIPNYNASYYLKRVEKYVPPVALQDGCLNNFSSDGISQNNPQKLIGKITSANEEIIFYGGLDSIKVFSRNNGEAVKKIQFDFGKTNSGKKKLLGITIKDLLFNQYMPYTFNYFDPTGYNGPTAQDYWGFCNDAQNSGKLMIAYPGCSSTGFANRAPAWPAMKRDMLTEITYPTGGKTILEYEPHTANVGRALNYSLQSGDDYYVGQGLNFSIYGLIGGVRIKKIFSYDPVKQDTLCKEFKYNKFGTAESSGYLHIPPSLAIDCSSFLCTSSNNTDRPLLYLSSHNLFQGSGGGQHVSYGQVTVREIKDGVSNGYTEHEFFNDTNSDSCFYSNASSETSNIPLIGPYEIFPVWQFKKLPENFIGGYEKEKRVYNNAGSLITRVQTQYKPKFFSPLTFAVTTNSIAKTDICKSAPPPSSSGGGVLSGSHIDLMDHILLNSNSGNDIDEYGAPILQVDNTPDTKVTPNTGVEAKPVGARPLLAPSRSYYFFYRYSYGKVAITKSREIKETYSGVNNFISDTISYFYENPEHINPTTVVTRDSRSNNIKQQNLYAFDFNNVNNGDSTIYFMKRAFINSPIASFNYNNTNVISGGFRSYKLKSRLDSTIVQPYEEFSLKTSPAGISPATLNIGQTYPQSLNYPEVNFQKQVTYNYNSDNSLSHLIRKGNEKGALLWNYNKSYVVMNATNADSIDVAYTSFESSFNGNWGVTGTSRVNSSAVTGKLSYNLTNGNITKNGLNSSKSYIVSYWSSSTAASVNSVSATQGVTKAGWTYFEHKLPISTTTITLSGNVIIDELRLYPTDAQVTSYTFNPLFGVTSINSPNNAIAYYEYDGNGQLRIIRDADRNVLKALQYHYTGFASDTAVWRSNGGYQRVKPCPANPAYNTKEVESEQIDINPNSSTFGSLRWSNYSTCYSCVITDWQNTATALRCIKNAYNQNTGEQEREQKDMNPCSATYNQTRWVKAGFNLTACPPPVNCTGDDKRMINGVCVTGTKIYTASQQVPGQNQWTCTYHYEWPGCIKSISYTENRTTGCAVTAGCVPD